MRRLIFSFIILTVALASRADVFTLLQEVRQEPGDLQKFSELRGLIPAALDDFQDEASQAQLFAAWAEADVALSDFDAAREHAEAAIELGSTDALLTRAFLHMKDLRFADAAADLSRYATLKKKAKKSAEGAEPLKERIQTARRMLEHVEQVVIIDSVTVAKDKFIDAYKVPRSQGGIDFALLDEQDGTDPLQLVTFHNEQGDISYSTFPGDSTGYVITRMEKLANGTWTEPEMTGVSGAFPWMLADGLTLYYAQRDAEDGLGGYDIYMTTRDPEDGSFREGRNLGMPFNSAANDYMMAIDEENGVGWWATDRNAEDGFVTVYTYLLPDVRINYEPDTEGLESLARIDSFRDTWPEGEDYSDLVERIRQIDPKEVVKKHDFVFSVGNGLFYYTLEDFPSEHARAVMQDYLDAEREFEELQAYLRDLRSQYHLQPSQSVARTIGEQERERDNMVTRLGRLRSNVYKALGRK